MVNVGKRAHEHGLMMVCDVPCDVMLTVAIFWVSDEEMKRICFNFCQQFSFPFRSHFGPIITIVRSWQCVYLKDQVLSFKMNGHLWKSVKNWLQKWAKCNAISKHVAFSLCQNIWNAPTIVTLYSLGCVIMQTPPKIQMPAPFSNTNVWLLINAIELKFSPYD